MEEEKGEKRSPLLVEPVVRHVRSELKKLDDAEPPQQDERPGAFGPDLWSAGEDKTADDACGFPVQPEQRPGKPVDVSKTSPTLWDTSPSVRRQGSFSDSEPAAGGSVLRPFCSSAYRSALNPYSSVIPAYRSALNPYSSVIPAYHSALNPYSSVIPAYRSALNPYSSVIPPYRRFFEPYSLLIPPFRRFFPASMETDRDSVGDSASVSVSDHSLYPVSETEIGNLERSHEGQGLFNYSTPVFSDLSQVINPPDADSRSHSPRLSGEIAHPRDQREEGDFGRFLFTSSRKKKKEKMEETKKPKRRKSMDLYSGLSPPSQTSSSNNETLKSRARKGRRGKGYRPPLPLADPLQRDESPGSLESASWNTGENQTKLERELRARGGSGTPVAVHECSIIKPSFLSKRSLESFSRLSPRSQTSSSNNETLKSSARKGRRGKGYRPPLPLADPLQRDESPGSLESASWNTGENQTKLERELRARGGTRTPVAVEQCSSKKPPFLKRRSLESFSRLSPRSQTSSPNNETLKSSAGKELREKQSLGCRPPSLPWQLERSHRGQSVSGHGIIDQGFPVFSDPSVFSRVFNPVVVFQSQAVNPSDADLSIASQSHAFNPSDADLGIASQSHAFNPSDADLGIASQSHAFNPSDADLGLPSQSHAFNPSDADLGIASQSHATNPSDADLGIASQSQAVNPSDADLSIASQSHAVNPSDADLSIASQSHATNPSDADLSIASQSHAFNPSDADLSIASQSHAFNPSDADLGIAGQSQAITDLETFKTRRYRDDSSSSSLSSEGEITYLPPYTDIDIDEFLSFHSYSPAGNPSSSQSRAPVASPPYPQGKTAFIQSSTGCIAGSGAQDAFQLLSVESESDPGGGGDVLLEMDAHFAASNYCATNALQEHGRLPPPRSCRSRSRSFPSLSGITSGENETFRRAESSPDVLRSSSEEFTPDENDGTYRFQCSWPGLYRCSVTGLQFHMAGEGDVVYRTVPWDRRLLAQHHKKPAGPLFEIKCEQQSVRGLHLQHCEVRSAGGCDFLSVAHVKDEGDEGDEGVEFIVPREVTETHVVVNITGFSAYGIVNEENSPPVPVRALVLLFYRTPVDLDPESLLNVLLLPRNVVLRDVLRMRKKIVGDESYIEKSPRCKLTPEQDYTLSTRPEDDQVRVEPRKAEFDTGDYDNYFPSFQVTWETTLNHIELLLRDADSSLDVWESRVCLSSASVRRSCRTGAPDLPPPERLLDIRSRFVEGISGPVLKSLLDKLLEKTVITDAEMESANTMPNVRDKARFVIDTVRKKGEDAASEMIEFLCEADPFLCEHLGLV